MNNTYLCRSLTHETNDEVPDVFTSTIEAPDCRTAMHEHFGKLTASIDPLPEGDATIMLECLRERLTQIPDDATDVVLDANEDDIYQHIALVIKFGN